MPHMITMYCCLLHSIFYQKLSLLVSSLSLPDTTKKSINPLNAELNPICCLLALFGAHHFLHVSRIRVKIKTQK
jgi:hypothetical protein